MSEYCRMCGGFHPLTTAGCLSYALQRTTIPVSPNSSKPAKPEPLQGDPLEQLVWRYLAAGDIYYTERGQSLDDMFKVLNGRELLFDFAKWAALDAAKRQGGGLTVEQVISLLSHQHGWRLDTTHGPEQQIIGCWCGKKLIGLDEFNEHFEEILRGIALRGAARGDEAEDAQCEWCEGLAIKCADCILKHEADVRRLAHEEAAQLAVDEIWNFLSEEVAGELAGKVDKAIRALSQAAPATCQDGGISFREIQINFRRLTPEDQLAFRNWLGGRVQAAPVTSAAPHEHRWTTNSNMLGCVCAICGTEQPTMNMRAK